MSRDELKVIAAQLVTKVRKSVTIDWTLRESARAKFTVMIKRILKRHGYPPNLEEKDLQRTIATSPLLHRIAWFIVAGYSSDSRIQAMKRLDQYQ